MRKQFRGSKSMRELLALCVLFGYAIIAGASLEDIGNMLLIVGGVFVVMVVVLIIKAIIEEHNKKERLNQISSFEEKADFDTSDKIGDDSCMIYFEPKNKKVLITTVSESIGVTQHIEENIEKDQAIYKNGSFCVLDSKARKMLHGISSLDYKIYDYAIEDKNKDVVSSASIKPNLSYHSIKLNASPTTTYLTIKPFFVLVEESYGFISTFYESKVSSFNYILKDYISSKTQSQVIVKNVGKYVFVMDNFFKVLVILSPDESPTILNYNDIMNVAYEEDGNTLYSRSTARTVGGAVVGGALLGGAGAIVGGLSGATAANKKVKSMSIKLLLRKIETPSITLRISLPGETFNTKEEKSKKNYDARLRTANEMKDLVSVIIDAGGKPAQFQKTINSSVRKEADQVQHSQQKSSTNVGVASIADELAKLAKLKESGILSEEEFNAQKSKLLGL